MKKLLVLSLVLLLLPLLIPKGKSGVTVILEAYDSNGNLVWRVEKDDPLTQNFARLLELYLYPTAQSVTLVDTSGTSRSIGTGSSISRAYIAVGTGSTSFSPSDYKLATQVQQVMVSQPTTSIVGNRGNISFSASFAFSSSTTVTEVGVIAVIGGYNFLLARDVLPSAYSVPAGGSLVVTYIIQLNRG